MSRYAVRCPHCDRQYALVSPSSTTFPVRVRCPHCGWEREYQPAPPIPMGGWSRRDMVGMIAMVGVVGFAFLLVTIFSG